MSVIKGLIELVKGMGITGKHLGRHAVTIQYPEEKWTMPERSRGVVVLLSDHDTGDLNCTACLLCEKACPTRAIKIESYRDENKRMVLKSFTVDNTVCCFCGLCEDACNFCAIKMAPMHYEMSVYDKNELLWDWKKLKEMGSGVEYEDTRKVKKPARIEGAPPPAERPAPPKPAAPKPEVSKAEAPKAEAPKADTPTNDEKPATDSTTDPEKTDDSGEAKENNG